MVSLGWRSMSDIIDLLCCKYVFSLSSENIRKHRRLEFCHLFHTIQFTVQRFLANLRDLKTYEFHRCIAEYLVCARIEFIFTGNGGKCAKIRLISWRCFLSQIFVKIFDASQVNTRRKMEESREILIGWKWDENGAHTDLSATHSVLRWTVEIFQFLKNFDTVCLFGKFSAFSKWSKFPHFKIFSKKHLPVKIYPRVSFITLNIFFSQKYVINGNIFSSTEVHFKGAVPP